MADVEDIQVGEPCLYTQDAIDHAISSKLSKYKYRVLFTSGTGEDGEYCNEIDIENFYDGRIILIRDDLNLKKVILHQSMAPHYYMCMFDKNASEWEGR